MKTFTPEEKIENIQKLRKKLNTVEVESIGYNRYLIKEKYLVTIEGASTWLNKCKMCDEEGNIIPLANEYNSIFKFTLGVAAVCIRWIQFNGNVLEQNRRTGLIDLNGKELLPCIYDLINVHFDGFTEITKDGQRKKTYLDKIINGEFEWEKI